MKQRFQNRKLLITGGGGYIGSTVAYALADEGAQVHIVDSFEKGYPALAKAGKSYRLNLHDNEALSSLLHVERFDAVLHFAAYIEVGESVREPLRYYRNNVGATLSLLKAMQENALDKLVFSSTAAVYGEPQSVPIKESHPLAPINPYGRSKRMMEEAFADCMHAWGLSYVALRYFNAAGAEEQRRTGECHNPETHLIPLAIEAAIKEKENAGTSGLFVFGDDYPTKDGSAIRDYIHVADLAEAHLLALLHLFDKGDSTAFNLGTSNGLSVFEIIEAVKKATKLPLPYRIAPRRQGDPARLIASNQSIKTQLGWLPTHSDPERIAYDAFQWRKIRDDILNR